MNAAANGRNREEKFWRKQKTGNGGTEKNYKDARGRGRMDTATKVGSFEEVCSGERAGAESQS